MTSDNAQLAVLVRQAQWDLDAVAHALPEGRCTPEQLARLADALVELARVLRARHEKPSAAEAVDSEERQP